MQGKGFVLSSCNRKCMPASNSNFIQFCNKNCLINTILYFTPFLFVPPPNQPGNYRFPIPLSFFRTSAGAGALFSGLISQKIPQENAVAADRAFFHSALSAKVTVAKARGCGHFSVKHREGRRNECRCRSVPAINGQERRETAPHSDFRPTESLYI